MAKPPNGRRRPPQLPCARTSACVAVKLRLSLFTPQMIVAAVTAPARLSARPPLSCRRRRLRGRVLPPLAPHQQLSPSASPHSCSWSWLPLFSLDAVNAATPSPPRAGRLTLPGTSLPYRGSRLLLSLLVSRRRRPLTRWSSKTTRSGSFRQTPLLLDIIFNGAWRASGSCALQGYVVPAAPRS